MPTVVDIVLQDMFQLSKSLSIPLRTQRTGDPLHVRLSWLEIAPSATILIGVPYNRSLLCESPCKKIAVVMAG